MYSVAVDGPSGAGKSSIAKMISEKLKISYFNTGDLYRASGLYIYRQGIEPNDYTKIDSIINDFDIYVEFRNGEQHTFLNKEDVTELLHTSKMSEYAMLVGRDINIRNKIVEIQRATAEANNVVMEGRDIGTVILPHSKYKFFITASVETRAKRMLNLLKSKGEQIDLESVKKDVEKRDYLDYTKEVGPLKQANDAILIETDNLTLDQAMEKVLSYINE